MATEKIFLEFLKSAPDVDIDKIKQEKTRDERVRECATSMEAFAKTYFPDIFDREFCEFHKEIIHSLEDMILNKKNQKNYYCRAAPRGHGKSQIISFLLILWCIYYGYKRNILLISDTNEQARGFIIAIKAEIENNELLIADFGKLAGELWAQDRIVTTNDILVVGKGAGQKLRGVKWKNSRPDLVIIDDLENDESVETENQRAKLKNWFLKALLPVGTPTTDYVFIGTILHYESLLNTILTDNKFASWNRKIYRAVYKFSDSDKWQQWEEIITDLSRENPAEDAYKFYQEHKEEMLEGIKVLWPDQDPDYYYNLMVMRVTDEAAFNSEYQNEPIDPNSAEFKEEWFQYYTDLPEIVDVYGAVDPSMGKQKSDRGAIVWVGKGVDNYLYVLDVEMGRYTPDRLIDLIILGAIKYSDKLRVLTCETVQFQAMFADELKKRALNAGIMLPVEGCDLKIEKELRLRSLIPKIKNGYIKFHKSQVLLLNEFRRFPKGTDDGMDALEMCVRKAYPSSSGLVYGNLLLEQGRRFQRPILLPM